jgi:hypothetical protein
MKSCEYVEKIPIYITHLGGIAIDPSEYAPGQPGAFFDEREVPCRLVADPDHKYCPRHELITLYEAEASKQ